MKQLHSCHELLEYLSEYIDGTIKDQAICEEIEIHLADCEDCQVMINTLEKTIYLYHASADKTSMPKDVRERLFQRLDLGEFLDME